MNRVIEGDVEENEDLTLVFLSLVVLEAMLGVDVGMKRVVEVNFVGATIVVAEVLRGPVVVGVIVEVYSGEEVVVVVSFVVVDAVVEEV